LLISLIKEGAVILIIIFIIFFNTENCQTAVTVTGVSLRSDIIFDFICCDILMFRFFLKLQFQDCFHVVTVYYVLLLFTLLLVSVFEQLFLFYFLYPKM